MVPEATRIQEVVLDRKSEIELKGPATSNSVVVETSEVVGSCGCPVNLRAVKDVINDLPPEYKETAYTFSLALVSLVGLFFSTVLYRYLHQLYIPEPQGFFCRYFGEPFSPLFDALCEIEPLGSFFYEMRRISQVLASELEGAFSDFIQSLFDGFRALTTIFGNLIEGLTENVSYAIRELVENVSENIAILLRFCVQFVHSILLAISNCVQAVSDIFHALSENV